MKITNETLKMTNKNFFKEQGAVIVPSLVQKKMQFWATQILTCFNIILLHVKCSCVHYFTTIIYSKAKRRSPIFDISKLGLIKSDACKPTRTEGCIAMSLPFS